MSLACLALCTCGGGERKTGERNTWELDFSAGGSPVERWLSCTECSNGELDSVVALGPAVVQALSSVLRDGWDPATREAYRRHLDQDYDSLLARASAAGLNIGTRQAYVAGYLSNVDARQRVRAAQALGAMRGEAAEAALREALGMQVRPDVHQAVVRALQRGPPGDTLGGRPPP